MNELPLDYRALWLPRRGHGVADYEDAFAADSGRGRFAIADGASESGFSGLWARLLVEGFVGVDAAATDRWTDWLPLLQERWAGEVGRMTLPWYGEAKAAEGAFAAFLGLTVDGESWSAVAVGDCCLFLVRCGRLLSAFPMQRASEFDNCPWLVGSRTRPEGLADERAVHTGGHCCAGDRLWLMSDALAQWFLNQAEAGGSPWEGLESLLEAPDSDQSWPAWVEQRRDARDLRNDDVTLMLVRIGD